MNRPWQGKVNDGIIERIKMHCLKRCCEQPLSLGSLARRRSTSITYCSSSSGMNLTM
jgi:hypothetical protein